MLGVRYFFIFPQHSLRFPGIQQLVGLLAFALGAAVIIAIGELVRRQTAGLQQAQGELEEKV